MKKFAVFSFPIIFCLFLLVKDGFAKVDLDLNAPQVVMEYLIENNKKYQGAFVNGADISLKRRHNLFEFGQEPYAVVVSCSDSRVVPEHVFNVGIGELFVIRNAGNVISEFELGSIEYAVSNLGSKLIMVMGHENCGAVKATIKGSAHGNIASITNEINHAIGNEKNLAKAELLNVYNSMEKIKQSPIVAELLKKGEIDVVGIIYKTSDGSIEIIDNFK